MNFFFEVENDDSTDSSEDDNELNLDNYNKNLNNSTYQKCFICNFFRGIFTLQINHNVKLYLCSDCRFNYIDEQFYNKLKLINKYYLLTSVLKRKEYRKDIEYFINKIYEYHLSPNFNFIECLDEMDLFISHVKNNIIFHPSYPNISTFISLLKNI